MTSVPITLEQQAKDLAGIGRCLSQGRLSKSLSVEEAAQELHLQPRQVKAMEAGDFSNFSSAAFVKGHLRACAKLYGLDGDKLVSACDFLLPPPKESLPLVFAAAKKDFLGADRNNKYALLFFAAVAIFLLAIAALLRVDFSGLTYHFIQDTAEVVGSVTANDGSVAGEAETVPQMTVVLPVPEHAELSAVDPANDSQANNLQVNNPPVAVGSVVVQPVSPSVITPERVADNSALHIEFIDECWVQIKSDDGKILHEKIHRKGEVFDMQVNPPVHLWLGRAAAANLSYNGIFVTIPVKRGAQSAQFVIGDELRAGEVE